MAAAAIAVGAEPSFEQYSSWKSIGDALAWAEFSDFDVPGSVGHSLLEHLGMAANASMGDLCLVEPEDFKTELNEWSITTSLAVRKARLGEKGRAIKAHHAIRIACGAASTIAERQAEASQITAHDATIACARIIDTISAYERAGFVWRSHRLTAVWGIALTLHVYRVTDLLVVEWTLIIIEYILIHCYT